MSNVDLAKELIRWRVELIYSNSITPVSVNVPFTTSGFMNLALHFEQMKTITYDQWSTAKKSLSS